MNYCDRKLQHLHTARKKCPDVRNRQTLSRPQLSAHFLCHLGRGSHLSETFMYLLCTEAKKHCWYFEGLYPTYYICRPYEDCCGSRCCVRALSIQRLWYFWFLLMMGVLFCCGAGFFIRRRMYPPPLIEEPAFNVSYTRQPPNPAPA
ncbi:WW domain binding protein VOPP1 isoform X3 [Halichoerus grypus]